MENFGDFIRKKRLELNLNLREFAKEKGYQPSYISRLENRIINPPQKREKLKKIANALEIKKGNKNWTKFFDLAAASKKTFPKNIKENFPEIEKFLPAFYRTLRKKEITEKDIKKLLELLSRKTKSEKK